MEKILVAWIGYIDLKAVDTDSPSGSGPIAQAVDSLPFNEIHLLNNFHEKQIVRYPEHQQVFSDRYHDQEKMRHDP
jgi:hypothetical protein